MCQCILQTADGRDIPGPGDECVCSEIGNVVASDAEDCAHLCSLPLGSGPLPVSEAHSDLQIAASCEEAAGCSLEDICTHWGSSSAVAEDGSYAVDDVEVDSGNWEGSCCWPPLGPLDSWGNVEAVEADPLWTLASAGG